MEQTIKKKRVNIEVDEKFHAEVKSRAALRNITISKWVMRAILEQIKREKQYE